MRKSWNCLKVPFKISCSSFKRGERVSEEYVSVDTSEEELELPFSTCLCIDCAMNLTLQNQ